MYQRFVNFLRVLTANGLGSFAVAITTTSFVLFVIIELLRVLGIVTSSYIGLITYLALPALFIFGLILIPIAWRRLRKSTGKTSRELLESEFTSQDLDGKAFGSRVTRLVFILTVINIIFLGGGTARMLHFMEEPKFCGTACHSVMGPEWATYQESPHAHVRCVDCHVGEGAGSLIDSKINGLWQMISVTFDLYEKPIPTPVHQLRPARETCEKCHWPEKFYGDRLVKRTNFAMDETSTPRYSTLSLKIGSGTGERHGEIHWHIAEQNEVRYASVDDQREEILWVEARQSDGGWKRYENRTATETETVTSENARSMDCVDCHNRATHIYEDPEDAVDARLSSGEIDADLPFVKRETLAALTGSYTDLDAAMAGIHNRLNGFYRREYPRRFGEFSEGIDRTVATLQAAYRKNVHHDMNVMWGAYPSFLGHKAGGGCFRCHNENMLDEQGASISYDCTLCHSILSYESEHPFQYLLPVQEKGDPDAKMHRHLQNEFLQSLNP